MKSARNFSEKVNKVLLVVLLLLMGLGFRCFQLAIIQHENYVDLSKKPKRRTTIETANRGLIYDRTGQLLAFNSIDYCLGVSYDEIRKLPRTKFTLRDGKFQKIAFRSEYIKNLCSFLEKEISLDPYDLEDLIHGKASLFPNQTFAIKEGLSLNAYQRMRAIEKDWPGLKVEMKSKRVYPNQKLASHILGYMGVIHQNEYDRVKNELNSLQELIEASEKGAPSPLPLGYENLNEIKDRYLQLKNKAYQLSSLVGKSGIEGRFDESLRGVFGKKKVEVDIMGREIRVLPDSKPAIDGDSLSLSIDKDLQKAAEILLTQHEEKRDKGFRLAGKNHHLVNGPWIKGGSIVALDPKSGQVLALASYPRFDPNDFMKSDLIHKNAVTKWLELPSYFEKLWEGELLLEKELYDPILKDFYTSSKKLSYEVFIETILSNQSKIKKQLSQVYNLKTAKEILINIQLINSLLDDCPPSKYIDFLYSDQHISTESKEIDKATSNFYLDRFLDHQAKIEEIKDKSLKLLSNIPHNSDKLLFLDILRLFVPNEFLEIDLPDSISNLTISEWFDLNQQILQIEKSLYAEAKKWFHKKTFRAWRTDHFKQYLKEKRKIEKETKKNPKPYLEYLEAEERAQFRSFYKENKSQFLSWIFKGTKNPELSAYEEEIEKFKKNHILDETKKTLKSFLTKFDKLDHNLVSAIISSVKSLDDLEEPLYGRYRFKGLSKSSSLKDLAKHFYPATGFGYSRSYAYQEAAPQGSIFKIITAYEGLRQYLANPQSQSSQLNPLTLTDNSDGKITDEHSQILGYLQDGKKISRFYRGGKLPRSSKRCGKITIKEALEMSSNLYFAILTADGLKSPLDLTRAAKNFGYGTKTGIDLPGEISGIVPYDIVSNRTGLYALSIGQHSLVVSPLQTAKIFASFVNGGFLLKPEILYSKIKNIQVENTDGDGSLQFYNKLLGLKSEIFEDKSAKKILETKYYQPKTVLKKVFYPIEIQNVIVDGLKKVMNGDKGTARAQAILFNSKEQKERYLDSAKTMIGKTASAEIVYHPFLDHDIKPILCKHIWFASAGYKESNNKSQQEREPEIVIVVYLRYGDYGKEAALMASELYQEFKKLKNI